MAKRRRRRSSSPFPKAKRRRSKRRSSGGGGGGGFGGLRRGFAFLPPGGIMAPVASAAGFVGCEIVLNRLNLAQTASGFGRIMGKVAVAAAAHMIGKKIGQSALGTGFAAGAMTSAAVDLWRKYAPPSVGGGVAGLGWIGGPDGIGYQDYNAFQLNGADDDLSGLGAEEVEYVVVE